jgi:hypothetical protein
MRSFCGRSRPRCFAHSNGSRACPMILRLRDARTTGGRNARGCDRGAFRAGHEHLHSPQETGRSFAPVPHARSRRGRDFSDCPRRATVRCCQERAANCNSGAAARIGAFSPDDAAARNRGVGLRYDSRRPGNKRREDRKQLSVDRSSRRSGATYNGYRQRASIPRVGGLKIQNSARA